MSLAGRTAQNSLFSLLGFIWMSLLGLATVTLLVSRLQPEEYGIYALATTFLGFFAFFDVGLTAATVKFVAEHHVHGDIRRTNAIVNNSLVIYLVLGFVGAAVIWFSSKSLAVSFFKISPARQAVGTFAFHLAGIGLAINLVLGTFASVPKALQRLDISTKVTMAVGSMNFLTVIGLLVLGFKLKAVLIGTLVLSVLSVFIHYLVCRRLLPDLRIRLRIDRETFREMLSFGVFQSISQWSGTILFQFDKLLLGYFLGASAVMFYTVPLSLAQRIHALVSNSLNVVFPLSSELQAKKDFSRMRELYKRSTLYALLLGCAGFVPLASFSPQIMLFWMGPEFVARSSSILILLSFSYLLVSATVVPYFFFNGMGLPQRNALYSLFSAVLNVAACLLLIPRFGLFGAAMASLIGMAQVPFFVRSFERTIGVKFSELPLELYWKLAATGLIVSLVTCVSGKYFVHGVVSLGITVVVAMAAFPLLFQVLGFFAPVEKAFLRSLVPESLGGRSQGVPT